MKKINKRTTNTDSALHYNTHIFSTVQDAEFPFAQSTFDTHRSSIHCGQKWFESLFVFSFNSWLGEHEQSQLVYFHYVQIDKWHLNVFPFWPITNSSWNINTNPKLYKNSLNKRWWGGGSSSGNDFTAHCFEYKIMLNE